MGEAWPRPDGYEAQAMWAPAGIPAVIHLRRVPAVAHGDLQGLDFRKDLVCVRELMHARFAAGLHLGCGSTPRTFGFSARRAKTNVLARKQHVHQLEAHDLVARERQNRADRNAPGQAEQDDADTRQQLDAAVAMPKPAHD